MRSINNLQHVPAGQTISSDDIVELHSAWLLLLISICGTSDRKTQLPRIDGLTKIAKLDFFVRYPAFFERVARELGVEIKPFSQTVESKMVRYHYGPWDERYYQLLPYLEARNLVSISKEPRHNQYQFFLTETGKTVVQRLLEAREFQSLRENINQVARVLRGKTGNQLKNLVYQVFDEEVAKKSLGEPIG
jgi:DNA-binding PadR family transcriptional regulator